MSTVNEQYAFKEVRLKGKNKVRDLVRATVFFKNILIFFNSLKKMADKPRAL